MFFILPLPTEDQVRLPVASILYTLLILGGFYFTWLSRGQAEEAFRERQGELAMFLQSHPGTAIAPADQDLLPPPMFGFHVRPPSAARKEPEAELDADAQTDLDGLVSQARAARDAIPYLHYALVPARGVVQRGWITSIFVHAGWLHLLGNLFFMYLTAPFVEEALGTFLFLPFFLLGGMVANVAEVLSLGASSQVAVMGASGAIAACLGAFGVRFATERKVKVLTFFMWLLPPVYRVRVWMVPAWAWVGYFGAYEAYSALVCNCGGGVAHFAHLGGLVFGAAVAYLWGKRAPLEVFGEQEPVARIHIGKAVESLRAGDRLQARQHYANALQSEAGQPDALLGLLRLDLAEGHAEEAGIILASLVRKHLAMRDTGNAVLLAREFAAMLDFGRLGPQLSYALCLALNDVDDAQLLAAALETAVTGGGLVRGKAMLRKARLCQLHGDLPGALAIAGEIEQSFPELGREAQAIRVEVEAKLRPPEGLEI